jgi:ABC-type multidrug transport system fused ATPase/permease subunit
LKQLMAGRTAIVISHRLVLASDFDHIVVLEQGRVAESGSHDELLSRKGKYSQLSASENQRFMVRGVE